jgi:epoxyqueuosine reductase
VADFSTRIIELALAQGFARAGIADAAPTRYAAELIAWLEAGRHGSMGYLAEHLEARLDPNRVLAGARSAIMVADLHSRRGESDDGPLPPGHGRIARYARGRDYHVVMKKRLHALADALRGEFPGEAFRAFVDTAPVLEREYAQRAGLGWIGKHTLLIDPKLGSYLLVGGIFTTLKVDRPPEQMAIADHCGACTRCIEACPTQAIAPHSVDASRCISYLTIERRASIAPEFHEHIGEWLYGCDICQEVCPHNSPRPVGAEVGTPRPEFASTRSSFDLLDVLGWDEAARSRAFQGSAMKRATLAMMKRNALIVAANHLRRRDDAALRRRIHELAADHSEPPLVRDTAQAVLDRMSAWNQAAER